MWSAIRARFSRRRGAALALAVAVVLLAAAGAVSAELSAGAAPPLLAGPDFAFVFGRHYAAALEFVSGHPAADDVFRAWDIPPAFAWAIVLPELIRYSALVDVIESANLKVLYVEFGHGYGDASVGRFQMKPSFAETLEGDFLRLADPADRERLGPAPFDRADTVKARRERARRLTDVAGQARYVAMFVRVMDKLYPGEGGGDEETRLRFYAAAYNAGYRLGVPRLRREMAIPHFHTGLFAGRELYVYADVAADYWRRATAKEIGR